MADTNKPKAKEEDSPIEHVFDVVEPDPVPEVKPVKLNHGLWVKFNGSSSNDMGPFDSEKQASEAGALYLATHPETSFTVEERFVQVSEA